MICPKCDCKLPMRYNKGANKKIVGSINGLKEWSFKPFYRCIKCGFTIKDSKRVN